MRFAGRFSVSRKLQFWIWVESEKTGWSRDSQRHGKAKLATILPILYLKVKFDLSQTGTRQTEIEINVISSLLFAIFNKLPSENRIVDERSLDDAPLSFVLPACEVAL